MLCKNIGRGGKAALNFNPVTWRQVDRDSVVSIATRYGLDGPGIESRWGRDFPYPVKAGPGAHPASYTVGTGCKLAGGWR
jgi:hypothetical protein